MRPFAKLTKRIRPGVVAVPTFVLVFASTLFLSDGVFVRASTAPAPDPIQREEVMQAEAEHVTPSIDATMLTSAVEMAVQKPHTSPSLPSAVTDEETLWLARCIYSETKRAEEQELVAWAVRNRVDTGYRGQSTYEGVVLDPYQFSAFNPNSRKRTYYASLTPDTNLPGWQHALNIAYHVRFADPSLRPFPPQTRHFYSERSLTGASPHPDWAQGLEPVTPRRPVKLDTRRFRFFEGVS
jgi:hypothetical protein